MARHFHCTACGKCCSGWLPLALDDAVRHAGRFPLAMAWMPVPQGARNFALGARLGATLKLKSRKRIAAVITPISYLPESFSCPALAADGRCSIHADKPARCRSMPFYAFREERDQADLLVPRPGWACDTSSSAPLVYQQGRIVDRADFDRERAALLSQAPAMGVYADYVAKYMPWVIDSLETVMGRPHGYLATSLSSFLTATKPPDAASLAARQLPVLQAHAARTAGREDLAEYHRNYAGWAKEMAFLAGAGGQP